MNEKTLITELDQLLDKGEPLLTQFPKHPSGDWSLKLPNHISETMRRYAGHVAYRGWDYGVYHHIRSLYTTTELKKLIKDFQLGLTGWRETGALPHE